MTNSAPARRLRNRLSDWARDELAPQQLVNSLNTALILGLFEVIFALSVAALIFGGELASQLPQVIGAILLGNAVLVLVVTLFSSYGGSMPVSQDGPSAIIGVASASLAAGLAGSAQLFPTVVLLIAVTSVVGGLCMLALGAFRLGGLVRFLPYPVVGGFLAGTGWLLVRGGISVATGGPLDARLVQPEVLQLWLPAVALGGVLWVSLRRWSSPLTLAAVFGVAGSLFYGVVLLRGASFTTLAADGWLLGPFPQQIAWHVPLEPGLLAQTNWTALAGTLPIVATAILVGQLQLLLTASSLELIAKRDISLDRELMTAGVANLAASLVGGIYGYHALSLTTLNHTFGKGKRLPGFLVAGLLVLLVLAGPAALGYVPRMLLASLLIYVGAALLIEWVVGAWFTFNRLDFAVIVTILLIIALKGFLWGVGVGFVLAIVLFVVSYSRVGVVRYELTGATLRSRVSRSRRQVELLDAHGDRIVILKLQGYIFFGTASNLEEHVRRRVLATPEPPQYVLLDFEQVSGMDSTGRLSFRKLLQFTRARGIELVLTGLSHSLLSQLRPDRLGEHGGVHIEASMDSGLQHCEDSMTAASDEAAAPTTLEDLLPAALADRALVAELIRTLQRRDLGAGERIIRQGELPDELFFLESGQLTAFLEQGEREQVRLETMQGGRMVGEVGFLLGTPRSASVVADEPSVVYVLTRAEWNRLLHSSPEMAQALNHLVLQLLGQRVSHLTRVIDALQQ